MNWTRSRVFTKRALVGLGAACVISAVISPAASASLAPLSVSANTQISSRDAALPTQDFRSPVIAINPTNPRNMVMASRSDEPDYACQIYYSTDGGVTWLPATGSTGSTFPDPPLPSGSPPSKTSGTCWSPGVAFDASGNVFVVAQDRPNLGGSPQTVIIWKSTNGGQKFGAPLTIPPSTSSGFSVQADIAIDTNRTSPHFGRIYVTWHEFPTGALTATLTYSDDGGATWSSPTTQRIVAGQNQTIPDVTVAPDGTVYVVFRTATAGGTDCKGIGGLFGAPFPAAGSNCPIQILRSSNGGASFDGDPVTVGTTFIPGGANNAIVQTAIAEEPSIVVTPRGTVLVAAATVPNPPPPGCAASLQAVVYRSSDRGQNWSAPQTVNDDPCASGDEHRDPRLSVAPNGRVDTAFYDDRLDPTNHVVADPNKGLLFDVFYANSTDDGLTFGPNTRVSDSSFDGTKLFKIRPPGSPPNGFQTRDYDMVMGLASLDNLAVAGWGDTRSGGPADLFTARMNLPANQVVGPAPPGQITPGLPAPPSFSSVSLLSSVSLTHKRFRVGSKATAVATRKRKRSPVGTTIRFRLSASAKVSIVIAQRVSGRRVGRRCVAAKRSLRKRRACTRILVKGTLTRNARQDANSVAFSGRIGRRALKPGRYQATLAATNAAGRSTPVVRYFRIVSR